MSPFRLQAFMVLLFVLSCAGDETVHADDVADRADLPQDSSDVTTPNPEYAFLEIADDPENQVNIDCSSTSSPGADIDSAQLFSDPSLSDAIATLTACQWSEPGQWCTTNSYAQANQAQGSENATAVDGFVSLNGGAIRCQWSDDVKLKLGMVVQVIEVSASGQTERHRLRACRDANGSECGSYALTTKALQTQPAGDLLF